MRNRSFVCFGILAFVVTGCGKEQPTLAAGKPVSHWLTAVHDPDAKVRKQAVQKLGNVGSSEMEVPAALTEALRDPDAGVRSEAILALMKCGPAAQDALPVLTDLHSRDRNEKVRAYAGRAVEKLSKERTEANRDG
jgi:HEAT repeat protein